MDDSKRNKVTGKGIPLPGNDIDTDRVIPARFMKCVTFDGLGEFAFYDARFEEDGSEKDHPFNDPAFKEGSILIVNKNFGCGSSREHAPQALQKYGITGVIGESFAEIFNGNCTAMGIPAVKLSKSDIEILMDEVRNNPQTSLTIDLDTRKVITDSKEYDLDLPESYRNALKEGAWDTTAVLLANKDKIQKVSTRLPYIDNFTTC
ncbi:3-isopropylmalate dehydratase small subunit [Spirochaeta cellobiosiphila]|uniref:3-isopropylmalate dehydratase small subunit n=1 Tax=Spirochaeta cellobiosiphila TaxID=504483 RepID=UPI000403F980|nr:3-isopropylmalate dehydratase small subunit [Spirochaeta cellobiosiphila]